MGRPEVQATRACDTVGATATGKPAHVIAFLFLAVTFWLAYNVPASAAVLVGSPRPHFRPSLAGRRWQCGLFTYLGDNLEKRAD